VHLAPAVVGPPYPGLLCLHRGARRACGCPRDGGHPRRLLTRMRPTHDQGRPAAPDTSSEHWVVARTEAEAAAIAAERFHVAVADISLRQVPCLLAPRPRRPPARVKRRLTLCWCACVRLCVCGVYRTRMSWTRGSRLASSPSRRLGGLMRCRVRVRDSHFVDDHSSRDVRARAVVAPRLPSVLPQLRAGDGSRRSLLLGCAHGDDGHPADWQGDARRCRARRGCTDGVCPPVPPR
jgi:hypothetical protein